MSDPELELIRKQRLAQLQQQQGGDHSKEDQAKSQKDAKNNILAQILDQDARARLNTLSLGKPEKGAQVEALLLRMAQSGQIRNKITERDLISLLEQLSQQRQEQTPKVKFDRRRAAIDDDDD